MKSTLKRASHKTVRPLSGKKWGTSASTLLFVHLWVSWSPRDTSLVWSDPYRAFSCCLAAFPLAVPVSSNVVNCSLNSGVGGRFRFRLGATSASILRRAQLRRLLTDTNNTHLILRSFLAERDASLLFSALCDVECVREGVGLRGGESISLSCGSALFWSRSLKPRGEGWGGVLIGTFGMGRFSLSSSHSEFW